MLVFVADEVLGLHNGARAAAYAWKADSRVLPTGSRMAGGHSCGARRQCSLRLPLSQPAWYGLLKGGGKGEQHYE